MPNKRPHPELSPREQELVKFAAQGFTDTAIATKLGISEATVGTYWGRVRIKLGPYSRTELVAILLREERDQALKSLRQENEELIEKLRDENESKDQGYFRSLLEFAPDAMVVVTESGGIVHANVAAHELFGYEKDGLEGKKVSDLIPVRFRDKHMHHRADYIKNPMRRQMGEHLETPALRKDGTEFRVRAALSTFDTRTGVIVTCVLRAV